MRAASRLSLTHRQARVDVRAVSDTRNCALLTRHRPERPLRSTARHERWHAENLRRRFPHVDAAISVCEMDFCIVGPPEKMRDEVAVDDDLTDLVLIGRLCRRCGEAHKVAHNVIAQRHWIFQSSVLAAAVDMEFPSGGGSKGRQVSSEMTVSPLTRRPEPGPGSW